MKKYLAIYIIFTPWMCSDDSAADNKFFFNNFPF